MSEGFAMRNLDFNPLNLPQEILAAIGLVASCSAHTEYVIEQGIGGCAGLDIESTAAFATHMATPMRDQVFRALAEIRMNDLDDLDELDRLLDAISTSMKVRNTYVHNSMCRDKDTGELLITTATARGSVEVDLFPITVDQIKLDAVRIYNAGLNLYGFLKKRDLLAEVPPSPRPRDHKSRAARKKRREAILKDK
jgi:hypothetical protein